MGSRRKGREQTLKLLYQHDVAKGKGDIPLTEILGESLDDESQTFSRRLFDGICGRLSEIDAALRQSSSHWKTSRMTTVDRNILRIGAYEILFCDDIPMKVAINEAVEIAKRFGAEDSGAFVNGVLDSLARSQGGKT